MKKKSMVITAVLVVVVVLVGLVAAQIIETYNAEVRLRNTIGAKQRDNRSEYDNLWKKISQVAQVTDTQKQALIDIFTEHARARGGIHSGDAVIKWLQESVPNVDTSTFTNLQNIIVGSRDSFTMRQKELLNLKREHDILLDSFPSGLILRTMGREKIDVTVITSSKAEATFDRGKDDDVSLPKGRQ
jgi:hypothetical protein